MNPQTNKTRNSNSLISDREEYRTDYAEYSRAIGELLLGMAEKKTGTTIGIFGNWGSGKTSMLRVLEKSLTSQKRSIAQPLVLNFNAWKYGNEEQLWTTLLLKLISTVEAELSPIERFYLSIKRYFKRLVRYYHRTQEDLSSQLLDEFRALRNKQPIVVIIDDLDRVPPDRVVPILEAVQHLNEFENISSVIAAERDILEHALILNYKRHHPEATNNAARSFASQYLEKLVQIHFQLPPLSAKLIRETSRTDIEREKTKHQITRLPQAALIIVAVIGTTISFSILSNLVLNAYFSSLSQYLTPIAIAFSIVIGTLLLAATAGNIYERQIRQREIDLRSLKSTERKFFREVELYVSSLVSTEEK